MIVPTISWRMIDRYNMKANRGVRYYMQRGGREELCDYIGVQCDSNEQDEEAIYYRMRG